MCEAPVFYATTEGQTARIAERIAKGIQAAGISSGAIDVRSVQAQHVEWTQVRAVVVGASLHAGAHQKEAGRFISAHRDHLNARPSWFFSVSLAAASKDPAEVSEARKLAQGFVDAAKWCPRRVICFAGRLAYTKYGWITLMMMRHIARREGASTDTSRDHEYTDWDAVDEFTRRAIADILARSIPPAITTVGAMHRTSSVA